MATRKFLVFIPIIGAFLLILTVAALIVVFSVESSWFYDNFQNNTRYGLWRLCFNSSQCYSWFSNEGSTVGNLIEQRLNQSRAGINAWQALEIIFLFLATSTLFILIISLIVYRFQYKIHYYLSILTVCSICPAALVGITVLFVFGFSVYNVSSEPRGLEWCFYVNLVAVILCILSCILLLIYSFLVKKPRKFRDEEIIESFPNLEPYPSGLGPSTFVIVRRDKKNRNKPYDYPQVLYPNVYSNKDSTSPNENFSFGNKQSANESGFFTTTETTKIVEKPFSSVTTNNVQFETQPRINKTLSYADTNLTSSTSVRTIGQQPSMPEIPRSFDLASTINWRQTGTTGINPMRNYSPDFRRTHFVPQNNFYPNRPATVARSFDSRQEPKILHYYTGYDYFATVDPSENNLNHYPAPYTASPTGPFNYRHSGSYQTSNDWLKSSM